MELYKYKVRTIDIVDFPHHQAGRQHQRVCSKEYEGQYANHRMHIFQVHANLGRWVANPSAVVSLSLASLKVLRFWFKLPVSGLYNTCVSYQACHYTKRSESLPARQAS